MMQTRLGCLNSGTIRVGADGTDIPGMLAGSLNYGTLTHHAPTLKFRDGAVQLKIHGSGVTDGLGLGTTSREMS